MVTCGPYMRICMLHARPDRKGGTPAGSPQSHLLNTTTPVVSLMTVTALPNAKLRLPDGNTTFSSIHSLDTKKMSERSPFCAFHNHKLVHSLHAPQCRSPLWCSVVTGHTCGDRILRLYVWRTERERYPAQRPGRHFPGHVGTPGAAAHGRPALRPCRMCARQRNTPRLTHTVPGKHAVHISPLPCSAERILIKRSANWANDQPPNGLMISQVG